MHFQDLSKRFITSIISLAILGSILFFSYVPLVKWVIALFAAGVGGMGIWEYCRLARLTTKKGLTELCIAVGALTILGFFVSTFDSTFALLPFILIFLGAIFFFIYHFDKITDSISSIAMSLFGVCYVAIPLGLILKILYLVSPCKVEHEGRFWLLYLLVVTKITDVGAYFGGRLFGNRKLASQLSPGKTVTGAIVGFCSAITFSLIFYLLKGWMPNLHLSLVESVWLGALLGFLGQVGDLGESLFKRNADVKDSNRLPGLGGILDMLDSLLFTTPVIYFFLYVCS
ncbi:phosphatidate cytidylyltransferase [Candidatus Neptunochlamydia vexilliferae]|uniref:Phosphatidate cytidylyltransferase n=1 Tax=Candidatus Neptunichlamydia vexilliferae TaxID=1651774 RepID=A0ABS0AXK8_9BACT|nr:phosphatidate cytidylyltransferase [Candidatus Neptunochlamydia vexilliferae]MBF5058710.1 Phosphatidate cytidylyltransferase [Candidatus Neptunochlamydia vexilliferae]